MAMDLEQAKKVLEAAKVVMQAHSDTGGTSAAGRPSCNDHYDDAAEIVARGTATTAEALGATADAGTGWTLFVPCFCVKFVTV